MAQSDVEQMKYRADRTRQELDRKLSELQSRVGDALDIPGQMARRPWVTLGVAMGLGFLVGYAVVPKRPEPQFDMEELRHLLRQDGRRTEPAGFAALAIPVLNQAARIGLNYVMSRRQARGQASRQKADGRQRQATRQPPPHM